MRLASPVSILNAAMFVAAFAVIVLVVAFARPGHGAGETVRSAVPAHAHP